MAGAGAGPLAAQGRIVVDSVGSAALAGNRLGDATVRPLRIYLPPSYQREPTRRFPVVYLLHGLGGGAADWSAGTPNAYPGFDLATAMDSLIAAGAIREFLVVMPDGRNRLGGSMFANSATTGDWETYLIRDVVAHVDRSYRTIRRSSSRGIAGHSMGAAAALRLAMRYPMGFGAVYGLSPNADLICTRVPPPQADSLLSLDSLAEFDRLSFWLRACGAYAAAWSPDSTRPPLYADLPFTHRAGGIVADSAVLQRWSAWRLLDMAPRYRDGLVRLRGLAFDVGADDGYAAAATALDSLLTRLRVRHDFEVYPGDHRSGIGRRMIERVLPFFTTTLDFGPAEP